MMTSSRDRALSISGTPSPVGLLEVQTLFHRALGVRSEVPRSAAAPRFTVAARVKELFVWPNTASTGDVLESSLSDRRPRNGYPIGQL